MWPCNPLKGVPIDQNAVREKKALAQDYAIERRLEEVCETILADSVR
jgi:hypothetical protein